VLDTLVPISEDIQTKDGRWYSARIHPYRTIENHIAGVVVACLDINNQKRTETELNNILDTLRESVIILDGDLKVLLANRRFLETFSMTAEQITGKSIFKLEGRSWDIPELRTALEEVLPKQNEFNNFKVESDFPKIGRRTWILNGRQILGGTKDAERKILLAIDDRTSEKD
jgi:two-component system, chemotaxis family, CheB/CheR fusion protein